MKIVLAMVIYDRYLNLAHWLECLQKCDTKGVDIVIIHNTDAVNTRFESDRVKIKYIPRPNIGYDIGAFQDVCLNRLPGFPEWDRLLWVTDDVFPMATDFIQQFNNAMTEDVGVVAMEISHHVKNHIRTSAFMIDKAVAEKLSFPSEPIITKRQCYEFEHMGRNAFYEQVIDMGLSVVQPWDNMQVPVWDSGYMRKLPRQAEHEKIFGTMPVQPPFISKVEHLKNEQNVENV